MSAQKTSAPSMSQAIGQPSEKSQAAQPKRKKSPIKQLPGLEAVYRDVYDAYAVVRCAIRTIDKANGDEDEIAGFCTLHKGLDALAKAVKHLEATEMAAVRVLRSRGAS